jgi:hypothetical protein
MAPPASVLSQTLQSITLTKIRELHKQQATYEARKQDILADVDKAPGQLARISILLEGVKELYPDLSRDGDGALRNIKRFVDQSHYDTSIPDEMLHGFENDLRSKLEIQSRKLGLAELYSRLLTEWMNPPKKSEEPTPEWESVDRQKERLQELCDKFESVVFEPLETDEVAIGNYMRNLFPDDESAKALEHLRLNVNAHGDSMLRDTEPFDEDTLKWCISGLLAEDLLSDGKQRILLDFLENDLVLGEIADVLNMRFADIKNWDWHAGSEGIPVLPRQQLNGKYRIWMDEDVLQAIFIHYIGVKWCVALKDGLKTLAMNHSTWTWKQGPQITQTDIERHAYYLGSSASSAAERCSGPGFYDQSSRSVESARRLAYLNTFFLSQLPEDVNTIGGYDNDSEVDELDNSRVSSSIKQRLLRQVASDVLLHQSLHGEVAVVQSDLQWYATGLSHCSIIAIMRFVGFSEDWISFFRKFLEAPLNMDASSDTTSSVPRVRKRGVPMAHAPEKLIGELVLFMLDLAVNRESGMLLYRIHDDLWVCGDPSRCVDAWTTMLEFGKVMGLEYNKHKTGSVYLSTKPKDPRIQSILPTGPVAIGFLALDPIYGTWIIDQEQVSAHIAQLQKQLAACDSVLSWVQTWNSCIGRFFSHTFGEPAPVFGRQHVDSILSTYQRMQETLFGAAANNTGNVTNHLKSMIATRFNIALADVPDGFLYLPDVLGGLGLRNPFIPLFLIRDKLQTSPQQAMRDFFAKEKEEYVAAKKVFDELGEHGRRRRLRNALADDTTSSSTRSLAPAELERFMSFEEFSRHRMSLSRSLCATYGGLLLQPETEYLSESKVVENALRKFGPVEPNLDAERKWIVELYAKDLVERYGGLRIVEKRFLPLAVLEMMRKKKVTWQMVL